MSEVNAEISLPEELNNKLKSNDFNSALSLIRDNRFNNCLKNNCSDVFSVVSSFLTDENFTDNQDLYAACENILKEIAKLSNEEEALFEFLELLETTRSDNVFTSTLKGLQVCLLRQKSNKERSLEWCLNSIQTYLTELPFPSELKNKLGDEEEKLLENNEQIRRILMNYLTLFLFYEPVYNEIIKKPGPFQTTITRKNVLSCFLLQLMGKPLAYLNLRCPDGKKSMTYSRQCAETLTKHFSKLIGDPFILLSYAEKRIRFPVKKRAGDAGIYEDASKNIFEFEEKTPLISLGVYFYLILVEDLMPEDAPKIYTSLYIFETGIYLVNELLKCTENSIIYKGIKLMEKLVENCEVLESHELELKVYSDFCTILSKVVVFSTAERNRKLGVNLLKQFIMKFDDKGRFLLIINLLKTVEHNGLFGYLSTLYKNIIAEALNQEGNRKISEYYSGKNLKLIILQYVCFLKNGTQTDLMENVDQIISALNMIRFLAIRDRDNETDFWDYAKEIEDQFLKPLRDGLNLSRAHYKLEEENVIAGKNEMMEESNMDISVMNGEGDGMPKIDKEHKLRMLASAFNSFDMMSSLLARVTECFDNKPKDL